MRHVKVRSVADLPRAALVAWVRASVSPG
ncbi:MAG: hypothetical protein R3F60_24695 [bacterium]